MALRLTSTLRARIARTCQALLTPPEEGNLASWREEVQATLRKLLQADTVTLRLPPHVLAPDGREDVPPILERAFRNAYCRPGNAIALGRIPPHGAFMAALVTKRPQNVAGLLWSRRTPNLRLTSAGEVELLRLIYPAFRAGVLACIEAGEHRARLCATLDGLAEGAALVDGAGRTVHRNRALLELLASDSQAELLLTAADALVTGLRLQVGSGAAGRALTRAASMETEAGRYRLFATVAEACSTGRGVCCVLLVEPHVRPLPQEASLRRRFGLSRREAEVALLLAQGRRNSHVAESLGISPHTARHHTEMVLAKLGTRSRAEVGAVLLRV